MKKASDQRAAIAALGTVVDDTDMWVGRGVLLGNAPGLVRRAIIHHDDLVVGRDLAQSRHALVECYGENGFLIMRGQHHRNAACRQRHGWSCAFNCVGCRVARVARIGCIGHGALLLVSHHVVRSLCP
jgi:hypothetical protein